MNHLPKEYLDETGGIRPGPNQPSFNNIVYSTQNLIGHILKVSLDNYTLNLYTRHIGQTSDENGLYLPKNSHDNITYKVIGSKILGLGLEKKMSLLKACIEIGPRPWDWVLYCYWMGNPIIRFLASLFLIIPALQCYDAVIKKEKIRPKMFDKNIPRYKWWFFKKEAVGCQVFPTYKLIAWKTKNHGVQHTRHMMNDGKHIALFKLLLLKKNSKIVAFFTKLCHNKLKDRYGSEYAYKIMKSYFEDQNHPNIELFKGIENLLERNI